MNVWNTGDTLSCKILAVITMLNNQLFQINCSFLQANHKCDPLPEGWFYTGTTYVSLTGEKSFQHPRILCPSQESSQANDDGGGALFSMVKSKMGQEGHANILCLNRNSIILFPYHLTWRAISVLKGNDDMLILTEYCEPYRIKYIISIPCGCVKKEMFSLTFQPSNG